MKLPNKILGGDARSFDCSTNQTTSSNVNPPTITKSKTCSQIWVPFNNKSIKIWSFDTNMTLPSGAKNRDTNSNGNSDSRESVRWDLYQSSRPRAWCSHNRHCWSCWHCEIWFANNFLLSRSWDFFSLGEREKGVEEKTILCCWW